MLPEEVVKDSAVFFVNPLHLVNVLRHSLHTYQGLNQVLLLIRVWCRQGFELQTCVGSFLNSVHTRAEYTA